MSTMRGLLTLQSPARAPTASASFSRPGPVAGAVAVGVAAGLLAALGFVVQQGVQRGAALRVAAADQADAAWRCSASKGAAARASCLATFVAGRIGSPTPAR
jgi:hypothetical protein